MSSFLWYKKHWFLFGLIAVGILPWIAFGQSLFQDFAAIDDGFLIVGNPIVHGLDFARIALAFQTFDPELYIPFTLLSFQVNWVLGGGSPFLFHLTNILLHSCNAILVAFLLCSLKVDRRWALLGAALFAIHPLHAEAVVWAAGRKDLLSSFFALSAWVLFRQWATAHQLSRYALSLLLFIFALLSKVSVATIPLILLLDVILLQEKRTLRVLLVSLVPFFAFSCLFLWIASFGKEQVLASSTLIETILMAQKSAAFYVQKLILPTGLTAIYPFQAAITVSPLFIAYAFLHCILLVFAFVLRKTQPLVTYGIFLFYITLAPSFFNFHKGDLFFFAVDRYAYIPSIGFFLIVAFYIGVLSKKFSTSLAITRSFIGITILFFLAISIHQTAVWDSPDTLFGRAFTLYPESVSARMAMASILRERNQLDEAFSILREGNRYSSHPGLNVEAGLVYSAAGQVEDAREQFLLAIQINPLLPPPMFYLGFLDEYEGKKNEAIQWYMRAVQNDSSYVTARVHLARLFLREGKIQEAEDQLYSSLQWNPVSIEAAQAMVDVQHARANTSKENQWKKWTESLQQGLSLPPRPY